MATQKQIEANRRNAKLGRGPTTPAGKARSSMNAIKTGVYAKHLLLPDENDDELRRLRAALYTEWRPLKGTESTQVEHLAGLLFKQGVRMNRAESGLYTMYRQGPDGLGGVATAIAKEGSETHAFTNLLRMDQSIERSIKSTIELLEKLQKTRGARGVSVNQPPAGSSEVKD